MATKKVKWPSPIHNQIQWGHRRRN